MALEGKGFYIWKVRNCEGGDANKIAAVAKEAGLSHVLVKIADGSGSYNIDNGVDKARQVIQALRPQGIDVWGWQYIYGDNPLAEARRAIQRVQDLGVNGFVVNAEQEFKTSGSDVVARKYMNELRNGLPNTQIALSTYRFPSYHPQFPYSEFLKKCDLNMPQVYWLGASNPDVQLSRSIKEYQGIAPFRPMVPTGFAFVEHGYEPTPAEVEKFLQHAKNLRLSAANFWSWDSCRANLPKVWKRIAEFSWPSAPPPKDIAEIFVETLNTRDPIKMSLLYTEKAVHVNAARTIAGLDKITIWYHTLFNDILKNARFELTGFSGTGSSRHFTWTATSETGNVMNGNDTLGLLDGKIGYHYTFFTIS
jgi:hypothetical protein